MIKLAMEASNQRLDFTSRPGWKIVHYPVSYGCRPRTRWGDLFAGWAKL